MHINFLYGILTDGDCTRRKTTAHLMDCPARLQNIMKALSDGLNPVDRRIMAELYIRLCASDKDTAAKLDKIDPVSTYKLADIAENDGSTIDIDRIVSNLRGCPEIEIENSDGPWDIIRAALIYLVGELYGINYKQA